MGKEVEKLESPYIAGMNVKWYSSFGKQFGTELSCDPITSLLGIHQRQLEHMFTHNVYTNVQSSIIHKNQKVATTQMSSDEWINKLWYIHINILAIKRNEVLRHAIKHVNPENIILSERTHKMPHIV